MTVKIEIPVILFPDELPVSDEVCLEAGAMIRFGSSSRKYHRLAILSEPSGAAISINGQGFGITPRTLAVRPYGESIQITISKAGYVDLNINHKLDAPNGRVHGILEEPVQVANFQESTR